MVIAAVYGPKQVANRRENYEKVTLEVIWKRAIGQSDRSEREAEVIVRKTLESVVLSDLHPRMGITLTLQVCQDDGSLLSCALNAASAALVDAGIPMKTLLVSVTCGVAAGGQVILDPTIAEEKSCQGSVCFALQSPPRAVGRPEEKLAEPWDNGIVTSVTKGSMSVDSYFECLERAMAATEVVARFIQTLIELSESRSRGESTEVTPQIF